MFDRQCGVNEHTYDVIAPCTAAVESDAVRTTCVRRTL